MDFEFWTKAHAAFGERTYWKCVVCGEKGSDEPALKLSAEEIAGEHLERMRRHYNALRLLPEPSDRRNPLLNHMKDELSIFSGRIAVDDCVMLSARIADEHYRFHLKERDGQMASLVKERNTLRRALDELVREARGSLREPGWTLRDELSSKGTP